VLHSAVGSCLTHKRSAKVYLTFLADVRTALKILARKNTLAYFVSAVSDEEKRFVTMTTGIRRSGTDAIKLCFIVIGVHPK
jgi:hypothetical protein